MIEKVSCLLTLTRIAAGKWTGTNPAGEGKPAEMPPHSRGAAAQPSKRRMTMVALWPPKPKPLLMATSIFFSRATLAV